ncbi:dehydroquinate dehydratase, putative / shikimate dehydrogenase, putative [Prunus dulcis]|uniref:Dehydroquinate dehydratase, putative / shikimate dehydrogenase, putative n=1 Tax=Prunus dulcis TaxID=3755 RepID=A0A4Y1RNB8_PRUDU|nr:dehydroquinate dehydratase, putative / shikimate dehydrogenase, putative [Prunus dulcis]
MDSTQNILLASSGGLQVGSKGVRRSSTLICAPIMAESVDKMLIDMDKAKTLGADLLEIRLDHLRPSMTMLISRPLLKNPLCPLFSHIGGQYDGDEKDRLDALRLAMELGADYIDVELQVAHEFIDSIYGKKPEKFKVIVSSHNYQHTPSVEALGNLVARIQATGADIVKIATTAMDITDVARIFHITVHSQGFDFTDTLRKIWWLSYFWYAGLGIVSAPGQPTMKDVLHLYNFAQIGPDTKVFGIIGKPVSHSKSPFLYNEGFKSVGFNGVYVHLLVDDIAKFLQTYSSMDFAGFSITIPHKEAALKCCDEVDPVAKSIGAINCIIRRPTDGKLFGFNTDYVGAISAIEDGLTGSHKSGGITGSPLAGRLFVVIGAGGAGKALAYGAKQKGARIAIANRTYDRARELADTIGGDALSLADLDNFHPEEGMILANTTSIGMQPKVDETPISKHALRSYSLVFDAVYTPKMTRLLKDAEASGAIVVSGLEMFIGQAYEQFERFTGLPAPKGLFRKVMDNSS